MIDKLKKRLIVWNIWKEENFWHTKWQKFCVLLGIYHSLSFDFLMRIIDIYRK